MQQQFLGGKVVLHGGDSRRVLARMKAESVDSVVCDPPYGLTQASRGGSPRTNNPNTPHGRTRLGERGFMGKTWDTGETAFDPAFWVEVLRVLKPGGHLLAFGGTRTYHRLACAVEDAGFEIRDMICWHYATGMPKSRNVGRDMDKRAGVTREKIATGKPVKRMIAGADQSRTGWIKTNGRDYQPGIEVAVSAAAQQWDGWGSALKPATEPIVMARKPLIGTIAETVAAHGTGALNIDGCRIASAAEEHGTGDGRLGRWPANICHDGSAEVMALFPQAGGRQGDSEGSERQSKTGNVYGKIKGRLPYRAPCDQGSAARFFFTSKAGADDRLGTTHPTVKPLDLMQWLVRLVTPRGGIVLDPFAGTGTTGEAAWREGMRAVLIEREPEYQAEIARRMELADQPTKRAAVGKTKNKLTLAVDLPLFAGGLS